MLTEARLRGDVPNAVLVEAERTAKQRLAEARASLHQAMARAISGVDVEPSVERSK